MKFNPGRVAAAGALALAIAVGWYWYAARNGGGEVK
jgi:hypothetical protein